MSSPANPVGRRALETIIADVYDELRGVAAALLRHEPHRPAPAPTSLLHDAIMQLGTTRTFESADHLLATVARVLRHSLVDRARKRCAVKHGGGRRRVALDAEAYDQGSHDDLMLDLDHLLEQLASHDPRVARVVELRLFGGLGLEQAALVLGVSRKSVSDDWTFGRAWLASKLGPREDNP